MRYFIHKNTMNLYILLHEQWLQYNPDGQPAGREVLHMYVRRWFPTTEVFITPVSHWMRDNKLEEIACWHARELDEAMVDEVLERVEAIDDLVSYLMGTHTPQTVSGD